MKKYFRILFFIGFILLIVFLQLALINSAPYAFSRINLILLALILSLFFWDLKTVILLALGLGLLTDIFSFQLFGFYTITLFAVVFLADSLLANWFTNRSTYSFLALTFFTTLFYNFVLYTFFYLSNFLSAGSFFLGQANFWLGLGLELVWNLGIIFLFFWIMNLTTNKLKPVFLDKR
jgi:cell shape-determining protein MreD